MSPYYYPGAELHFREILIDYEKGNYECAILFVQEDELKVSDVDSY